MAVLPPGTPAPEFRLVQGDGEDFTQEDLKAAPTVLVFYPAAFSLVCTDQLQLYEPILAELAERGARMYGVSCDSALSQSAFIEKLGVTMPQLSDFEPKGAASAAFGVLHPAGICERALMIFDADGVVRWSYQAENPGVLPPPDLLREGIAAALG
jgi:peroxiredoxin